MAIYRQLWSNFRIADKSGASQIGEFNRVYQDGRISARPGADEFAVKRTKAGHTLNRKTNRSASGCPRYPSNRDAPGATSTVQPSEGTSGNAEPERPQQRPFRVTSSIGLRPYLPATILVIVTALVGFWPTYFGPALKGRVDVPPVIHLHAVIFVTWLALFATQVVLAAKNRVKLHMQLGRWIFGYGLLLLVGAVVATAATEEE
jgi:hypothetical protein